MICEKTFELIEQMSKIKGNGSRAEKEVILKEHKSILQEFMSIAFDVYRIFHIQKLPKKSQELHKWLPSDLTELAGFLEKQKGGTNSNKDLVRSYCEYQGELEGKWSEAAILKNVKMGLEVKTLNKCGYNIPVFDLLLAVPNKTNSLEGIKFPCYVQKKEDGCRMIRFTDGTYIGRTGKNIPNPNVAKHIDINTDFVLDGEFVSPIRSLPEIVSIFRNETKEIPPDIKFVLFNAIPFDEWKAKKCSLTNRKQLVIIHELSLGAKNVEMIESHTVHSAEEVFKIYNNFLDQGYEGAMVKNIDATYQWKRVNFKDGIMVKLKPEETIDGKIVGYYEGKSGRNIGRFGGFKVQLEDGVITNVGGGYSDDQRIKFWKDPERYIGEWVIVNYTDRTPDNDLQFARFYSFRDNKN